jgi:hypothetical protein
MTDESSQGDSVSERTRGHRVVLSPATSASQERRP